MHARVGRVSFSPDKADAIIEHVRSTVMGVYQGKEGYKGFRLLVDRENGVGLGVTYWDSEEHLHATDEISEQARSGAAAAAGGSVEGVEVFEIVIDESA